MKTYINKTKVRFAECIYIIGVTVMILAIPYVLWLQSTVEEYESTDWIINRLIILFLVGFIVAVVGSVWKWSLFRCPNCGRHFLQGPFLFSKTPKHCGNCGVEIEVCLLYRRDKSKDSSGMDPK